MEKGIRNCEDQLDVQLSDIQVGVHKVSHSGFYLTFFTMDKHCQLNFAKDIGYKLVLVKQLRDSVSVNL